MGDLILGGGDDSIYLGPKVDLWEHRGALSIYYIATWTLCQGRGRRKRGGQGFNQKLLGAELSV